ncbi:hypothetical protein QBC37DRAFT_380041 [Rhypophila decipiens]|uniref:Uncharacterized protein n=1 Tax=Rhypophila decipiens TaxID=261697 RepID=A0AAN7B241_9PEZI|nr:hypothetical protein QBC37DRAFT_380041 [Rhypophila decipiens]
MKTSAIAIAIAALAGLVAAVPAPASAASPEVVEGSVEITKRGPYNVFITEHANWGGRNELLTQNTGACRTLGNGWPNTITAFGPDPGVTCTIYDRPQCQGSQFWPIRNPGYANLNTIGWNDRIQSFNCL